MKKNRSGLLLLVLMVFALSLGVAVHAGPEPIKIGLQAPITGPWAYEGEMARNSVQIVADEINRAGGILGRPLEIVLGDDQGSPKQSALVAQRMLSEKVVAVVGTYGSSVNDPASAIYERAGLVNIAYGSTAEKLTEQGRKFFFRTCFRDDRQGSFFAKFATDTLKAKRVAIVHDNTTFGKGLAEAARRPLEAAKKADLVFYDAITPGERDFTAILSRMGKTNPDVLYFTGYYSEAGLVIRQMRTLGIKATFVGGNAAINDEFVKIAGLDMAKGALMTQEPLPKDLAYPESKSFLAEYQRRNKEIPSSPWPVYAADGLKCIAAAIKAAGSTDSKKLADYLHDKLEDMPGITGPISFDEVGDREGAIYLAYQVTADGKFVPLQ
ncbi:MAG: branched-chain amino acid ABC transporter substrate-binding protein [Clostridia bacterium]|nr:branched-chain amino acid ABC transporter substrate-binding protein [Clostridia bacterium]